MMKGVRSADGFQSRLELLLENGKVEILLIFTAAFVCIKQDRPKIETNSALDPNFVYHKAIATSSPHLRQRSSTSCVSASV